MADIAPSSYVAWEPACGEGHIAEVLKEYFGLVRATDIFDYGYQDALIDFLKTDWSVEADGISPGALNMYDWIITNPPFQPAEQFALRAIERAKRGVALFVRWQWIESVGRYERLFNLHPPLIVAPFAERVPLHKGRWEPEGATATAYCWIVWTKTAPVTQTRLLWIPPGLRKALTEPDDIARFTAHPVIKKENFDPESSEVTEAA